MQQTLPTKRGHKKLKIFLGITALLVAGFFIYKYTYIYVERRKYDKASVAINKVADDLRAQGIQTEFSRGCQRAEGVFGAGAMSCSVGISYIGDEKVKAVEDVVNILTNSMQKNKFSLNSSYNTFFSIKPIPTGSSVFSMNENNLVCQVTLDNDWDKSTRYEFQLSCGNKSQLSLF